MRISVLPVALAGLLLCAGACSDEAAKDPPSILLVVIDTLRADAASAYGITEGTTPAFDALAATGQLYTRAYAPSPWTLPSHASLFTGSPIDDHGVGLHGQVVLAEDVTTLAERLRAAGYQTAAFSENALISRVFGFEQGFESFSVRTAEEQMAAKQKLVIDVADELARWLEARDPERPFFVFINLYDPHEPYVVRAENPFLPASATAADVRQLKAGLRTSHLICERIPPARQLEILHGLYLGEVAAADQKLKAILTLLGDQSASGLVTVVTSDHGEHFGEHGLLDHEFSVRDTVLRIPLVVHGPALGPAIIERPVELRDVTRSLLTWAGADASGIAAAGLAGSQGAAPDAPASLFALYSDTRMRLPPTFDSDSAQQVRDFKRQGCSATDRVFGDMVAVTRYPFKLNWYERYPSELFDLSRDPGEQARQQARHSEVFSILEQQAREFAARTGLAGGKAQQRLSPETEAALRALGYID
ncbi:MAG: sulfatase [Proteobacteria bacterium]|nr:sulfatase [Pseudomonadota bacterium]